MNLFLEYQKEISNYLLILKKKKLIYLPEDLNKLKIELPPKKVRADFSCNAALILSKINKKDSMDLANFLKELFLKNFKEFEKIDTIKPGFLNISLKIDFWEKFLFKLIKFKKSYGSAKESKKNFNIEFVSANPTGPMHVGHCRGAIIGDTLANILKFNGHKVTKEYYVNDHGGQIKNFSHSVYYRILEKLNSQSFPDNKDLYQGSYIIDIANEIIQKKTIKNFDNFDRIEKKLTSESLDISIKLIKKDLDSLGVKHDNFVFESKIIKNKLIDKIVKKLKKNNYIYYGNLEAPKGESINNWKKRKQLLFKSSIFGDDTDRALQKDDLTWTYFAGDIAYHANKIERNFDFLINILGSDHVGYIKRIVAVVKAISNDRINLVCKVSQLVKLFKNGKPFKMSKRRGEYITAQDLIKEIGKDSVRFIMLNRSNDVELEFDFNKVTEKSKENPIFYVQYAYARINSIFRLLKINIENKINLKNEIFCLNNYELEILRKISEWPRCIEISSNKLEPHRIPYYLYELATLFHSYWNLGKENEEFRFIKNNKPRNISRLILLQSLAIVIRNGMSLLGVSAPKSM